MRSSCEGVSADIEAKAAGAKNHSKLLFVSVRAGSFLFAGPLKGLVTSKKTKRLGRPKVNGRFLYKWHGYMKNRDRWVPTKFVYRKGKLISSKDTKEVEVGSRLIADITATLYDTYIPQYVKGKLLDLGCGAVPLYEAYKNLVTDNVCIDWKRALFLDFECDLTKELPVNNGDFDTVIMSDVLEHIPQPEKLWQEMYRLLKPNGKVIINVPFYYWVHEGPHDYNRYTEFALRRLAELTGFTILLLRPIGGSPEILADILAKHLKYVPLIGPSLSILIQFITGTFIRTSFGKKFSEKTNRLFPLGYFLVAEKTFIQRYV